MKTAKTLTAKILLAAAALFITSIAIMSQSADASSKTAAETRAAEGVTNEEVTHYLQGYGYTVRNVQPIDGSLDKLATTQNPYQTVVFVQASIITGHEDIP
jgi:hypothetical protein